MKQRNSKKYVYSRMAKKVASDVIFKGMTVGIISTFVPKPSLLEAAAERLKERRNSRFEKSIFKFNDMYGVSNPAVPQLDAVGNPVTRLEQFMRILHDELTESSDIFSVLIEKKSADAEKLRGLLGDVTDEELALVMLMDWLGDIQVYCASEMRRYGLPIDKVLDIIMESNFSKLDENGNPIIDSNNKVGKGPNYWKPEPKLLELLREIRKG